MESAAEYEKSCGRESLKARRHKHGTPQESESEKVLREEKWEYINCFYFFDRSEAEKERIFGSRQVHLGGDGSNTLTDEQIAYLREKYDMRHLTGEDACNFLCDLTEMNVFSAKDWAAMMIDKIQLEPEDVGVMQTKNEGIWAGCGMRKREKPFW
ncbi:MAG: hypothetical protein HFI20_13240 [Lachnospiraceae bacterium]|nr:hypothetical protein [Lachnospiraceae bacterium]MCI9307375.1 hypothetical protein [Lachnospiraceae bacterium]